MSTFIFRFAALRSRSGAIAFRAWRHGIGLLLLSALASCQSGEATTTTPQAALDTTESTASNSSDAPVGTVTFSIDGQPEPGVACGLTQGSAKGGFRLSFSSELLLDVSVYDNDGKLPLAVGKFAVLDWTASRIWVQAALPTRFNKDDPERSQSTYSSWMGIEEESPKNYINAYDWGAGVQRLRGREVGQVVFTRISNGTADGTFQSFVYNDTGDTKAAPHQGQDRVVHRMKEHLLKGTFIDVPVLDMQKALRGEQ